MDKNTITGLILILAIIVGFSVYSNKRTAKFFEAETEYADSLYNAGDYTGAREAYLRALNYRNKDQNTINRVSELNRVLGLNNPVQTNDTTNLHIQNDSLSRDSSSGANMPEPGTYGVFSSQVTGEDKYFTIENNKLKLTISARGGRLYSAELRDYTTYDSLPVVLFNGDSTVFGYKFFTVNNKAIETNNLYFVSETGDNPVVITDKPDSLVMRLMADNGAAIEYVYTLHPDEYMIDFETHLLSMGEVIPSNASSMVFDWKMYIPQQEKGRQNEDTYTGLKYKLYQEEVQDLASRQKKAVASDNLMKLDWIAYKDQFFSTVLIADDYFLNASVTSTKADPTSRYLKYFESEIGVPFSATVPGTINMKIYLGPNSFTTLKKYDIKLEELIFLGRNIIKWISQWIIIPIFNFLDNYIVSYGLIILILTVLIKAVLFPLTHKSFISQAKMRIMKPMVDEISKKYPKQEDAMKKQQATMDLYKKAGVSPMGGCLPMLLQMPFLFAMFRFFPSSIELRHEPFLWAKDLSTYDAIFEWKAFIPFIDNSFGTHLSLFTLLMTVSTIISTKISNPSGGQEQMPGMKSMMYVMPVMFMFILNNFSAGLTYYYFLANVISIIQTQVSRRFVSEAEILKKMEENRKKPVKKSQWQARMDEVARQRGIKPMKK